MEWYDRRQRSHSDISKAEFSNVTATVERRLPSWICGNTNPRQGHEAVADSHAPKDPTPMAPQPVPMVSQPATRAHAVSETPGSASATTRYSTRPPSSISLSPSELESRFAEHAVQRTNHQIQEQAKAALVEALESLDQARRDMLYAAEPRLIELAVLVAKRVIARELKNSSETVADLVREGVDALAVRDKVRLTLGSGFAQAAAMATEQLAVRGIEVDVRVSTTLSEYGCIVETDIGRVDESIEARLDLLIQSIERESEA